MGTGGGGGGGKKGGNGDKRLPEDKIEIENHPGEGEEDDSSSETSLELNLDPQQLASVRLDRPLLKLRLMPRRRRRIATAPGGGGTPPPTGGGTVTVPLPERQNGTGTNQPIEGGGAHHNHQMVWVEELGHYSQKGVEEYHSNWQVEEELCYLVVMVVVVVVVMGMVMVMEEVIDHLPQGEMEEMTMVMVMMMEMVVKMIHHHCLIMDSHDTIKVKEIDGCTLYKDHLDPQVNLDKMVEMVMMDRHHSYLEE